MRAGFNLLTMAHFEQIFVACVRMCICLNCVF